jgi:2-polyprenyl-6-methoxyphenol hydroxylase-like FAD-dependent oxidoreductase
MAAAFEGMLGVHGARTLDGMAVAAATDSYFARVSRVEVLSWRSRRVTLVGEAGYCPAPTLGMGTSIALYGEYVLAGELISTINKKGDGGMLATLARYERTMHLHITEFENVPNQVQGVIHPYLAGISMCSRRSWLHPLIVK